MHFIDKYICRLEYKDQAYLEWDDLNNEQKKYISYLFFTNEKYDNPNNSHLLYALGITDDQPTNLVTRKGGAGLCDLDLDFSKAHRHLVIDYVRQKYGKDKVAHIGTFNMNRAKAAVRAVTRTLGHPIEIGDKLSRLLLAPISGKPQSIATSLEKVKKLNELYQQNDIHTTILDKAQQLEGLISSAGVHASGVVISNESLLDKVPFFKGRSGEIATQWDMHAVEDIGYIKFDFLGLDALTKIRRCLNLIEERHNEVIDIDFIPKDDEQVFENLRKGDSAAIFQLEGSSGMRDLLVQIRPTCLEDITALVAIYRPGPLESPELQNYLDVRAGRSKPHYLIPELESILGVTNGLIIYQEQVMRIATDLCGYTNAEADDLRKAIGKKIPEKMAANEPKFKDGWVANGYSREDVEELWNQVTTFGAYGFNKAHAASYAFITYQTAWLKTHYPIEYMCAVMSCELDDQDDLIKCIAECKRMGIQVLPPDINKSSDRFLIDKNNNIRFGLSAIKNLGDNPVQSILQDRSYGKYKSLLDFCKRVNLSIINSLKVESLVRSGAFDNLHDNRNAMLQTVANVWDWKEENKRYEAKLLTYHKKVDAYKQREEDIKSGKLSAAGKKLKSLQLPVEPEKPCLPEFSEEDEMTEQARQRDERELLGVYITSHPLDKYKNVMQSTNVITVDYAKNYDSKRYASFVAIISTYKEITTKKKKQKMAFLKVEDLTGVIEAIMFPSVFAKYSDLLDKPQPLLIEGYVDVEQTDDNSIHKLFIEEIRVLTNTHQEIISETLEAKVSLLQLDTLFKLLEEYKGNHHKVKVTCKSHDGTQFRLPNYYQIGNYKGVFLKKLTSIQ